MPDQCSRLGLVLVGVALPNLTRDQAAERAALVTVVMAGDPALAASLEILKALPAAGADLVEIGMPFTDPMADGPAIQAAGLRALRAGTTLE